MEYQSKKIIFIPLSIDGYIENSGSERIRCKWIAHYLNADIYDGSQDLDLYNVLIYQKTFLSDFIKEISSKYQGKKLQIFDVCDPLWLSRPEEFSLMAKKCDFVTTSTEDLAQSLRGMGYTAHAIVDRIEPSYFNIKKEHVDKSVWLCWFGYSDRFGEMNNLIPFIDKLQLPLLVIADKPVGYGRFIKWEEQTWIQNIIRGDIVINPRREFKTNIYTNKSLTAWALGMPVAENEGDIKRFLNIEERIKESQKRLEEVKRDWNISKSAKKLLEVIYYEISKN